MIIAYKVMLRPNNKQSTKMFGTASAARYAYNWTVGTQMEHFEETGLYFLESDIRKAFTKHKQEEENKWLYDYSNDATKQAIKDACEAFKNFFDMKKKPGYESYSKKQIEKAAREERALTRYEMQGHPKFKKKDRVIPCFYIDTDKIEFTGTHVKLEKIADSTRQNRQRINWLKLAEKDRIPLGVKYYNPRVTYDGFNWWLSIGVETEPVLARTTEEVIGIDVGIKNLAILSDEEQTVYENINKTSKTIKKSKKKQRRLQRKISRKYEMNKEGEDYCKTNNIKREAKRLLKVNRRLTNVRHNHLHQTTSSIVKHKPSVIVVEDLNIKGMMKNKHLSKAIGEQCLHEFTRQLEYKSSLNGITLKKVGRYCPSSRMCSHCGTIDSDLTLNERTYTCNCCGLTIDRDYNAALNLKAYVST